MLGPEHLCIGYYGVFVYARLLVNGKKCLMFGIAFELELGAKGEIGIYEMVFLRKQGERSGNRVTNTPF